MNQRKLALAISVSTNLAAPIVGGFLLGYYLDRWFGTPPWLLLGLGLLGTIGGFFALYRIVSNINEERDEE